MHTPKRRVALFHNASAGGGDHARADLIDRITAAGHSVTYCNVKEDDIAGALDQPADLIVVAGGDGTVRRLMAIARPGGPPIAILPLGRANNIAKSLRVSGTIETLIASWRDAREHPFFPIEAEMPWGRQRLVEGLGFGALAQAIEELRGCKLALTQARRHIANLLLRAEP